MPTSDDDASGGSPGQGKPTSPKPTAAVSESRSRESSTGERVVHQGWLMKQGQFIKSWKKRYFILTDR